MSLQQIAGDWHRKRFPDATDYMVLAKAMEELGEVGQALNAKWAENMPTDRAYLAGNIAAECADVAICLLVLLDRWVPNADLNVEIAKKLSVLNNPHSGHRAALPS